MTGAAVTSRVFRFGPFELDEARFELRRFGVPLGVQPRVLETILFLAERSQRLVTKQELAAGPWNGLVVSDSALSQAIKQARDVLKTESESAPYIVTVPRKGFRFESPVAVEEVTIDESDSVGQGAERPLVRVVWPRPRSEKDAGSPDRASNARRVRMLQAENAELRRLLAERDSQIDELRGAETPADSRDRHRGATLR